MGLFGSARYKGRITTWPRHAADGGGARFGWVCECGRSSGGSYEETERAARRLLDKHMKNEHGH